MADRSELGTNLAPAVESNGLDIAAIHPCNGETYSPNLYAWLVMPTKTHRATTSRVFADANGVLWIGFPDDGYFIGSRLIGVLCNGAKQESFACANLGKLTEVAEFWARYMAIGRCAIDQTHTMRFLSDDTRWRTTGDHREFLWCGSHTQSLRRWIEPVERSAWEPTAGRGGQPNDACQGTER